MEANDLLDKILYRTMPGIDEVILSGQVMKAEQENYVFSSGFEKRMKRLFCKKRMKRKAESGEAAPEPMHVPLSMKRKLIPVLILILLTLTASLALAANFKKIVQRFHWYDDKQGADFYIYKSSERDGQDEMVWIYPSYIPEGYELTGENKDEEFMMLKLDYENGEGHEIWYEMMVLKAAMVTFDAEYDSAETVKVNGMPWFVTWRKDAYWMARVQEGDILYQAGGPPELPREEFMRILEGIIPVHRDAEGISQEVKDYKEVEKIFSGK